MTAPHVAPAYRRRGRARLAAVVAAVVVSCIGQAITGPSASAAACPEPIRAVLDTTPATADRTVALTFDDGPLPQSTPALLDVLRARGVKATFFVTGSNASRYPDLVARIVAEGHAIGNHTWSHPDLSRLSQADQVAEIERTTQAIVDASGTYPCFFRGPYGIHHSAAIAGLAWDRGMTVVDWAIDTRDWTTPSGWSPSFQQEIVAGATSPGGDHPIVLMHDGGGYRQNTVAAVDRIISSYASRGYTFVDPAGNAPHHASEAVAERPGGTYAAERPGGTYTVRAGDTLGSIAARHGVDWRQLYATNDALIGPNPDAIRVGQQLTIPGATGATGAMGPTGGSDGGAPGGTYAVQAGDTLSSIAARHGVHWRQLYAANEATVGLNPNLLRVGQQLTIPAS
jgi:peptidoglycan/xylan/chitin deacetylase (PgdA/CDA1 family)/LysM repeat protein